MCLCPLPNLSFLSLPPGAGLSYRVRRPQQFHAVENRTGISDFPFPLFRPSSCLSPTWAEDLPRWQRGQEESAKDSHHHAHKGQAAPMGEGIHVYLLPHCAQGRSACSEHSRFTLSASDPSGSPLKPVMIGHDSHPTMPATKLHLSSAPTLPHACNLITASSVSLPILVPCWDLLQRPCTSGTQQVPHLCLLRVWRF